MKQIADLILIVLLVMLCWRLTDGFRRDVAFLLPLILAAWLLRFVVLPKIFAALLAGQ